LTLDPVFCEDSFIVNLNQRIGHGIIEKLKNLTLLKKKITKNNRWQRKQVWSCLETNFNFVSNPNDLLIHQEKTGHRMKGG